MPCWEYSEGIKKPFLMMASQSRAYELCLRHSLALLGSELQHSSTLIGGGTPPNPPPRIHYTMFNPNILSQFFSWLWTWRPKVNIGVHLCILIQFISWLWTWRPKVNISMFLCVLTQFFSCLWTFGPKPTCGCSSNNLPSSTLHN